MTVPERGSEQPELDNEMEEGEDKESQRGRWQRHAKSVNDLSRLLSGKITETDPKIRS